jgi:hypothetical protein
VILGVDVHGLNYKILITYGPGVDQKLMWFRGFEALIPQFPARIVSMGVATHLSPLNLGDSRRGNRRRILAFDVLLNRPRELVFLAVDGLRRPRLGEHKRRRIRGCLLGLGLLLGLLISLSADIALFCLAFSSCLLPGQRCGLELMIGMAMQTW